MDNNIVPAELLSMLSR